MSDRLPDCLRSLLFQYLGLQSTLTQARQSATNTEYVLCFGEGCILHVLVPSIAPVAKQESATMEQLRDSASAVQLSFVAENQMLPDFFALYHDLPQATLPVASDDLGMRCAAFLLVRVTSDVNNTVQYVNPQQQEGALYVHQIRSKGYRYSTAAGNDTGLVREGNLLQVLRMRRTCTAIFKPQPGATPPPAGSIADSAMPAAAPAVEGTAAPASG